MVSMEIAYGWGWHHDVWALVWNLYKRQKQPITDYLQGDRFPGTSSREDTNTGIMSNGPFTLKSRHTWRNVYLCVNFIMSNFNIASMVTQTQTHRMGLNKFSASMLIWRWCSRKRKRKCQVWAKHDVCVCILCQNLSGLCGNKGWCYSNLI